MKTTILKVEHFTSKNGKPCHVAWFTGSTKLPCKAFCPDWVEKDMEVVVDIVPDFRCNASFEFSRP